MPPRDRTVERIKRRAKYFEARVACIEHYGGWRCACCGESTPQFLTIDHIDGKGAAHRRTFSGPLYEWLVANNFPAGFRVLCFNCNSGRSVNGGYCPHEKKFKTIVFYG